MLTVNTATYMSKFSIRILLILFLIVSFTGPLFLLLAGDKLLHPVTSLSSYSWANFIGHFVRSKTTPHPEKDLKLRIQNGDMLATIQRKSLSEISPAKHSQNSGELKPKVLSEKKDYNPYFKGHENFDKAMEWTWDDHAVYYLSRTWRYETEYLEKLRTSFDNETSFMKPYFEMSMLEERLPLAGSCSALVRHDKLILYSAMVKYFRLNRDDERDSFINLHRYGYHMDSQACADSPHVLILVHSRFDNVMQRAKIRNTWAFNKTVYGFKFSTVFVVGEPSYGVLNDTSHEAGQAVGAPSKKQVGSKAEKTWKEILKENESFGDIVMGNFTDSYRNLTIKHIMGLGWALSHCPKVKYILKVDDDTIVNTYSVARHVWSDISNVTGLLLCPIPPNRRVQRKDRSKWFVSETEFPFPTYPPYCYGYGVVMTRDVVQELYDTSRKVKPFWIDDVYVTGLLTLQTGITPVTLRKNLTTVTKNEFQPYHADALFVLAHFNKNRTRQAYWSEMVVAQEHGWPQVLTGKRESL